MCSRQSLPLKFVALKQFDSQSTGDTLHGKPVTHAMIHFAVENYKSNKLTEAKLDSFGKGQHDAAAKVTDFQILLFKSSKKTDVKYLRENPRDFVRYSFDNDLLFHYTYLNGKFVTRFKYKNGVIIDPDIKLKVNVNVD